MTVLAERVRNRVYVTSRFPIAGLSTSVPGANFSETGGAHWSVPLTMEACRLLRERFGDQLEIGPDLWVWAAAHKAHAASQAALGRSEHAVLTRVPEKAPGLASAMMSRPFQTVGTRFAAEAQGGRSLLGYQPGLGKTLMGIGAVIENGQPGPHLVICPKTAVPTVWAREIPRWWPGQRVITVPDGRAKRDALLTGLANLSAIAGESREPVVRYALANTWVVVHPEMVQTKSYWDCPECGKATAAHAGKRELICDHNPKRARNRDDHQFPQMFAFPWGSIIADESDRALVRKTGRPNQKRRGMELLRVREGGLKIAASGTPFRSRPHLLWGTLNWLDPVAYPGFWSWCETYFDVIDGKYAKEIRDIRPEMEDRLWASLDRIMIRRTKAEVAKDLPPKAYVGTPLDADDPESPVGVWIPMLPAQRKAYDQMFQQSVALLDGGTLSAIGTLAEMTRLKQLATSTGRVENLVKNVRCTPERNPECPRDRAEVHTHLENVVDFYPEPPSNKLDQLEEFLLQMGFPDAPQGKVIVVSSFTRTLRMLATELESRKTVDRSGLVGITGEVTGARRAQNIDRFNEEVGTASPHLMFLNVDAGGVAITLDTADDTVIIDESAAHKMEQVEDRTHRISRPRQVRYHYYRSEGSIDQAIAMVNAELARTSRHVLDGRRGVEYFRRVMEVAKKL